MFPFLELPKSFDLTRDSFITFSHAVSDRCQPFSEEKLVRADEDIHKILSDHNGLCWVSEGSILLTYHGRRILAFEAGECIGLDSLVGESPFALQNELAVRICLVTGEKLLEIFGREPTLAISVMHLQSDYARILSELLSTSPLLESPFDPSLIPLEPGESVIQEGDEGSEIFTLVQGRLDVVVQGVKVGDVKEGEIFGVIAAFTGGKRTATVVATIRSLVMRLPKSEFDALVKQRPSLITNLVESLSRTICELDARVLENQVPITRT